MEDSAFEKNINIIMSCQTIFIDIIIISHNLAKYHR